MSDDTRHDAFATGMQKVSGFFLRTRGSGLLFCISDDPRLVAEVNGRIIGKAEAAGRTVTCLDLVAENLDDFFSRIKTTASLSPQGVIVNNLDLLIDLSNGAVIRDLNYARESLLSLNVPLLFWLNEQNNVRFAQHAPDLYLRRDRATVLFPPASHLAAELQTIETAIAAQDQLRGQLPEAVLETTLAALRSQAEELRLLSVDLSGSEAVALGPGAVAVGAGGIGVGGSVAGSVFATGSNNTFNITNVPAPVADDRDALEQYRQFLVKTSRTLPLRGIALNASDPTSDQPQLDLAQVYIDLETKSLVEKQPGQDRKGPAVGEKEDQQRLSALAAAAGNQRVVLLGDPGAGKSTFINHLVFCLAMQGLDPAGKWQDRLEGWPKNQAAILPIPVVLRDLAATFPRDQCQATPGHIWDFIRQWLRASALDDADRPLQKALEKGEAVVLLDGLDEISARDRQCFVGQAVAAFIKRYPKARIIVTCRVLAYQGPAVRLTDFDVFELAPFDDKRIDRFIDAWHAELSRLRQIKTPEQARAMAARLKTAIRRQDIFTLAPNPLLLTVIAQVNTHLGVLPDARAKLYEEAVDILLYRWDRIKAQSEKSPPRLIELLHEAGRSEADLKRKLWELAHEAHSQTAANGTQTLADIMEWQLEKAFAALHPKGSKDWAHQVINTIKLRAGLLLERRDGIYAFPHRTFQEYLAGAHLSVQAGFAKTCCRLAEDGAYWREAILLAVGRLVYEVGDVEKPLLLAGKLCPVEEPGPAPTTDAIWHKVWLAGDVLLEFGLGRLGDSGSGKELGRRVPRRLADLLQGGALEPRERVEAGNTLAKLGDPRFDKDKWCLPDEPLLGFVHIPAGTFLMGSDPDQDRQAENDEQPQHSVHLDEFYIARYPVTVAQFKVFVSQSGYKAQGSWQNYSGFDNHPVVTLTWYDAMAYCQWLTATLRKWKQAPGQLADLLHNRGWKIRLPSEAQWEKAARGTDGWLFPWGNDKRLIKADSDRANYDKTGVGETSAVGCFPRGRSPYELLDMAGNVWEWTRSLWGKNWDKPDFGYPYDPKDSRREDEGANDRVRRVLRGGAFWSDAGSLRCAYRGRYYPVPRDWGFGFRVVLSPG